jgi:hypothetical protein
MRNALSMLLFVAAAVLMAIAAYMFIEDWRSDDSPPPPPSIPGRAELKNVRDVFDHVGLDVEYGRSGARIERLSPAGQQLIVDGQDVYVFIFGSPDDREEDMAELEGEEIVVVDTFGDPVSEDPVSIGQGSNVVTALVDADDETQAKIDEALATLP